MGIIRAITGAISGSLADQWLEVIEADDMGDNTVFTSGVTVRQNDKRNSNFKGTVSTVSNGSIIHVYDNQAVLLVDGGKIVDYSAEPGYFTVSNSSLPSLFNGQLGESVKETFGRIKFSGSVSSKQQVFFINLQEIKGIKFGTPNPVMYYDANLDVDLYIRARGMYSIKITDPLKFYKEVIPRNASKIEYSQISGQYQEEFLSAFGASINKMSVDGVDIRTVSSNQTEVSRYMRDVLDEEWGTLRGFEILSVGATLEYDDRSQALLDKRDESAIYQNAKIREAFVQTSVARGIEAAGSNEGGAMTGFLGVGMGMQASGGFMNAASQSNQLQMQLEAQQKAYEQQQANNTQNTGAAGWTCECGKVNTGKFCAECGKPQPQDKSWTCECGKVNTGKFCAECGKPQPQDKSWTCECGKQNTGKFCSECGKPQSPKKIKCDKCGYEPDISKGIPKFCPQCGDIINDADKE